MAAPLTKKRILATIAIVGTWALAGMCIIVLSLAGDQRPPDEALVPAALICGLPVGIVAASGLILWHLHSTRPEDVPPQLIGIGVGCAGMLYFLLLCPLTMWISSL